MRLIRPLEITDAVLTSSTIPENDYAAYNAGTNYALGANVISTTTHRIYESLQAANTGHALTDTAWWLDIGATNRWRPFDRSVTSQASQADSINYVFEASGRVDSVALLNVSAATAQITMTDSVDGVVYDETLPMVSDSGITDWYAYFFEPIERITDLTVADLPPYANAEIEVTLTDTGDTVLVGEIIMGLSKNIGGTQWGASVGIQDYSIKQRDDFGNYTVLERAFNKRANFTVLVAPGLVDQLQTLLASHRAIPIVYIGDEDYGATVLYGFYRDFSIDIAYPTLSLCSIEIEALT